MGTTTERLPCRVCGVPLSNGASSHTHVCTHRLLRSGNLTYHEAIKVSLISFWAHIFHCLSEKLGNINYHKSLSLNLN